MFIYNTVSPRPYTTTVSALLLCPLAIYTGQKGFSPIQYIYSKG